ncbi:MAG TPA: recombinase family protein [Dehalococcoidia bacterium]|jgi:DNA invertase Pin-like site-specific DNA recombinase|nr:recombinase family protein [Dehalococcoidia bacterium]
MRAIGYFREAAAGGSTIAQQNKAFLDYCGREGIEPGDTLAEDVSANGYAPAFRQLVDRVRAAHGHLLVVVPSVDTLGSSRRESIFRCLQLETLGARIASADGALIQGESQLAAWLRDDDAENVSDRVRAAMRRKAVKGEVLGRPPYGYKVGSRRRLELIPEEAVVVRYIFRLYLQEHLGIRLIARRLNEEALKTRRGGNWSMVSIRDILRNRAYLGTYSRFGVRVPGSHPPLVSESDFRMVQDRLNAKRTSYAPRVLSQFLLSGLAECGYCGNKLIGVSRRQSWKRRDGRVMSNAYRYYQCESRTNQSVCGYHTRRAAALEDEVRAALDRAVEDRASTAPDHAPARSGGAHEREVERLRARARAVERRFEGLVADVAKGRLAKDRLYTLAREAAEEALAITDALEAAERRAHGASEAPERDEEVRKLVAGWTDTTFDDLRARLRDAVASITVTDDDVRVMLR